MERNLRIVFLIWLYLTSCSEVEHPKDELVIELWDKDLSSDEFIGSTVVPLEQLKAATADDPLDLYLDLEDGTGSIRLAFQYNYPYSRVICSYIFLTLYSTLL